VVIVVAHSSRYYARATTGIAVKRESNRLCCKHISRRDVCVRTVACVILFQWIFTSLEEKKDVQVK
jgi:hypothetical protein